MMGKFIGWIRQDVERECAAELEASGLDRKIAIRAVETNARVWFKNSFEAR